MPNDALSGRDTFVIPGWAVGHWTDPTHSTGCTVILPERPALAIADVRGGAPGTRETSLLEPGSLVMRLDAVLLTGGSALGLAAADGVSQFLRKEGRGFPTPSIPVPIVAAAVLFDLVGNDPIHPDADSGYLAAEAATPEWSSGRMGAGAGATVGKVMGRDLSSPGGIGVARVVTRGGTVAALFAVNAFGDVVDTERGTILAGARDVANRDTWIDTEKHILRTGVVPGPPGGNTTIGVVVVDADVDRDVLTRLGIAAHDGLARAIHPAHTLVDGDTVFVMTTREATPDPATVLQLSVATQAAVSNAITASVSDG